MRLIILLFSFLISLSTLAATVEWNAFALYETAPNTLALGYVGSAVYANTSVSMKTSKVGDQLHIAESDTYLASFTAWTVAYAGEIVSADMLKDEGRLFYRCDAIRANTPFDVDFAVDNFYLAFETLVWNDEGMSGPTQLAYGWVTVDVLNGRLSIADSAIGLEGQNMIVGGGAIPEPSSGLMLLLGMAALSLRRKQLSRGSCAILLAPR